MILIPTSKERAESGEGREGKKGKEGKEVKGRKEKNSKKVHLYGHCRNFRDCVL